jgi:hypothetical protein
MSLRRMTFVMMSLQVMRKGEEFQDQFLAVANTHSLMNSLHIGAQCGHFDFKFGRDLLVAVIAQNQFDNADLLGRQVKYFNKLCPHGTRNWKLRIILISHDDAPKKESVGPRPFREPPPRGIANVPWPTPLSGRGHKALLRYVKNWRFSLKQRLDARASIQVVAIANLGDGTWIIPDQPPIRPRHRTFTILKLFHGMMAIPHGARPWRVPSLVRGNVCQIRNTGQLRALAPSR